MQDKVVWKCFHLVYRTEEQHDAAEPYERFIALNIAEAILCVLSGRMKVWDNLAKSLHRSWG